MKNGAFRDAFQDLRGPISIYRRFRGDPAAAHSPDDATLPTDVAKAMKTQMCGSSGICDAVESGSMSECSESNDSTKSAR